MELSLLGILAFLSSAAATGPVPVSRSGLAGINAFMVYDPYCGHGCFRSFSPFTLSCSRTISAGGHTTGTESAHDLALCRSSNFPYLSSIAWCIHLYCPSSIHASTIEKFWETEITGDVKILPNWSYGEVVAMVTQPPTMFANVSDEHLVLNTTMLTTYDNWKVTWETLWYFFRETAQESYYGLAICVTSFALPIVLTWIGFFPYMTGISQRIRPWLYPSIVGTYHDRPLPFLLGNAPTIGQSFYIAVVFILNIVFLAVGYKTAWPKQEFQWYENRYQELLAYFMWRTGVLAFCNMPVLFLFSSRNNILLWLTNWSHSTYMLLHRWIARIFLLQTLLHSIIALVLYENTGSYAKSLTTDWWIWGCVATVAAVFIVLTSFLIIRQRAYELFLITHIVMAVICVVGCWYHVWYGYENTFGYETWLYATIAVWFFDRLVRVLRTLKTGIRRAVVTDLGPTLVRVDVPEIRWTAPGHHVYLYFPTLNPLRPWENHPFSVVPTALLTGLERSYYRDSDYFDEEKSKTVDVRSKTVIEETNFTNSGLTFFIRKTGGMTRCLEAHTQLLTLLEGPYPNNSSSALLKSDRLVLIGGGIGITGLLPFLRYHPNAKLYHSVKTTDRCLVDSLAPFLDKLPEKDIKIGSRLALDSLIRAEASAGWAKIAVVVCGPAGMCDEVRAVVSTVSRQRSTRCTIELEVDAFSW